MSDSFVEDDFVESDFVEEQSSAELVLGLTPSLPSSVNQHQTDFREYRRGRFPSEDWDYLWRSGGPTRVDGAWCDSQHRNVLRIEGAGGRIGFIWKATYSDLNHSDQESLTLFRWVLGPNGRSVAILRAGGSAGVETAYRLNIRLTVTPEVDLDKIVSGVATSLGTYSNSSIKLGTWIWIRLRANGTTIQAKVWLDGDTEPVSWNISATDSSISSGAVGLAWVNPGEISEVAFFSTATNGETALGPLYPPLDTWISTPDEQWEFTARVEYYNPDTDSIESGWFSTLGRSTKGYDYPPNTVMHPLLLHPGEISTFLESDTQFNNSAILSQTSIRFRNLPYYPSGPGPLDSWREKSFYSRPVEIRIGRRYAIKPGRGYDGVLSEHRTFQIVYSGLPTAEPDVTSEEVVVSIGSPRESLLRKQIPAYKNVGIPTGVKSLSTLGYLLIPSSTSYNVTRFNISFRVYIPSTGVAGSGTAILSRREIDSTHRQWYIGLNMASHATDPNKITVQSWTAGGVQIVNYTSALTYNVNRFVTVDFSVNGGKSWYLILDDKVVTEGSLTSAQISTTASGANVEVLRSSIGLVICDHRIESWVDSDTALSRMSSRRDPDQLNISMHRCDDNSGSTVTDYATLANHGTLQGTDAIDRSWSATFLGSSELAGVPMPISAGVVYHFPTQPIDPVREAFRYNDRAKTTGSAIETRAKGLLLTEGANFTQPLDRPGVVDIVGASDQPITVGLKVVTPGPEDPRIHVPRLIYDDLADRGAWTIESCDKESFYSLRQLLPFKGGYAYEQPPIISQFLSEVLGNSGCFFTLDRSARIQAGAMLPPTGPGAYNTLSSLEFVGHDSNGVTLSYHSSYSLTQSLEYGVFCCLRLNRIPIDLSVSSTFTYFPSGMTLIDQVTGATSATSGLYLGLDGRDGRLLFGAPGQTNTLDSLHFTKSTYHLRPWVWYCVLARVYSLGGGVYVREIGVVPLDGSDLGLSDSNTVTGTLTASTGVPVRIGHGTYGAFYGSIQYVEGFTGAPSPSWMDDRQYNGVTPTVSVSSPVTRYFLPLSDGGQKGTTDQVLEHVQSRYARTHGTRWSPRMVLDFRRSASAQLPGSRRPLPSWQVETRFKQNKSRISGADVVASVSASDRVALSQEYQSVPDISQNLRENYLDSRETVLVSPLLSAPDAEYISQLIRERLDTDRLIATGRDWYRELLRLSLTDEVLVYADRHGFENGKYVRVATLLVKLGDKDLRGDVGVWG